jgi:outer membrane protein TolC
MTHPIFKPKSTQLRLLKFICLILFSGVVPFCLEAQVRNSNAMDTARVMDIRERLVQLALQNPNYEIADRQVAIANYQLKKAKNGILSKLNANFNANEYTLKLKKAPGDNLLFPLFNFGVSVPFDILTSRKSEINIAKENLGAVEASKNQRFREIKAEILSKYEDYLMFKQKLEYESQIAQDAEAIFLQAEKDFSDNIIKQEDYNKAYRDRTEEKTKLAEIVRNFNVVKIEIEKMIGIPFDELLQQTGK